PTNAPWFSKRSQRLTRGGRGDPPLQSPASLIYYLDSALTLSSETWIEIPPKFSGPSKLSGLSSRWQAARFDDRLHRIRERINLGERCVHVWRYAQSIELFVNNGRGNDTMMLH